MVLKMNKGYNRKLRNKYKAIAKNKNKEQMQQLINSRGEES